MSLQPDLGISPLATGPTPIGLAEPCIGDAERRAVWQALGEPVIAYGDTSTEFEGAVGELLGGRSAVAVTSGTAALHLGLLAVGVRPGDAVLVSTLTFVAPANAIRYVGATPLAFDAEPEHWQLDVPRLAEWLARECRKSGDSLVSRRDGRRIAAVVPVDLLGHPADVDALREVVAPYGIPIVEDAAEALGARLRGRPIGAEADVLCLSFNANKIITTSGGGMLLARDGVADHVRRLANQAKLPGGGYQHEAIGFNYLMPNVSAALGLAQLKRLDEFLEAKRTIADHYERELRGVPGITLPRQASWASVTHWLYTIGIDAGRFGRSARELQDHLEARAIQTRLMFTPLHRTIAHAGCEAQPCHVAERLSARGLTLPSSVSLARAPEQLSRVTQTIRAAVAA